MVIVSSKILRIFEYILNVKDTAAIAFFPFIFIADSVKITPVLLNHERIHLRQQLELLVLPFHIWYLIALRRKGYWNISFEKEAYANESNLDYLKTRKPYSFLNYL